MRYFIAIIFSIEGSINWTRLFGRILHENQLIISSLKSWAGKRDAKFKTILCLFCEITDLSLRPGTIDFLIWIPMSFSLFRPRFSQNNSPLYKSFYYKTFLKHIRNGKLNNFITVQWTPVCVSHVNITLDNLAVLYWILL